MFHLPLLRFGEPYRSLDVATIADHRSGAPIAELSLANPGLIRRDLLALDRATRALRELTVAELIAIGKRAADLLLTADLPDSPDAYLANLAAAGGLPHALGRANLAKLQYVLANLDLVLAGLTRGLDPAILDRGHGQQHGIRLAFYPAASGLGIVLPNNSPGVNSLWLPALALKTPVVLKPGSTEPFTPYRLCQALAAAGLPRQALLCYGGGHDAGQTIVDSCDRAIVFGDSRTVDRYRGRPQVSVHGPGCSKILIGEDAIDRWPDYLDTLADSILRNGGRSCVNASTIVVPRHGRALADALASRLAAVRPLPLDHPDARLAAFADPAHAAAVHARLAQLLDEPGAELITGNRLETVAGSTFLAPTLVFCDSPAHPLAQTEFMFPCAAVVQLPTERILPWLGPSLVVTAITEDPRWQAELLACQRVDRLNLGPIPTPEVSWDQPHEGNLFDFLYQRRAVQCR